MIPEITKYKRVQSRYNSLDQAFSAFRDLFKDVSDYILPRRGLFNDTAEPNGLELTGRGDFIIDNHATRANRTLGAGMQGGLCSPSRPWFRTSLQDQDLAKFGRVRQWLQHTETTMYQVLAKSNFYSKIHTEFEEEGGFGTAVIFGEEDFDSVVNFSVMTAGTYRLANGPNGMVNTVAHAPWMTADQMIRKFGSDNVGQKVIDAWKTNPYKQFRVIHLVGPRDKRKRSLIDNSNMPYESIWIDPTEDDRILLESGYQEAPFAAPRWNTLGLWPYGLGPGFDVRGSVKMLQEMQKSVIKGTHKQVDPPMKIPSQYKGVLSLLPGAMNYIDGNADSVGPLYQVQLQLEHLRLYIQDIKDGISKDYYNDLFLMIAAADKNMTATEVAERHEEKLLMLGPTIERQEKELLVPCLERVFALCDRAGLIKDPPPEIEDKEIKIEFVSLLSQAQKLVTAQSINAHMGMLERVGQLDPNAVAASTNFIELIIAHGDVVGVPPNINRSRDEANDIMQQIQEANAQAAQQEQALANADAMGKMGRASTQPGTALGDLKQAMGI